MREGHHKYISWSWFLILLILSLGRSLSAQGTLAITSPGSGATVTTGQTLPVKFSASAGVTNIVLVSDMPGGIVVASSAPGQFSLSVPTSTTIRQYTLNLVGVSNGQTVKATPVTIQVDTALSISSLTTSPGTLSFENIGDVLPVRVIGTLSDASRVDVTHSPNVTFASDDSTVATVGSDGQVTAVGVGATFITIKSPAANYSVYTVVSSPPTSAPTFSPLPGAFTSPLQVGLADSTPGAAIYYTIDPNLSLSQWRQYNNPIAIASTTTIRAYAQVSGSAPSPVVSGSYTILSPASTPIFSPSGGTYAGGQTVTISDATPGATIYYTTNGSSPVTGSAQYVSPLVISTTTTLKAVAVASGYAPSSETTATYIINPIPPDFSVTLNPSSLSLKTGETGSLAVSIGTTGSFSAPIAFSCSGLPAGASCVFSPSTITTSAPAPVTTLTVKTGTLLGANTFQTPMGVSGVFACCLFYLGFRRRTIQRASLFGLAIAFVFFLNGCGSGYPKSTSTVTVSAMSGSTKHDATFTLKLNQ